MNIKKTLIKAIAIGIVAIGGGAQATPPKAPVAEERPVAEFPMPQNEAQAGIWFSKIENLADGDTVFVVFKAEPNSVAWNIALGRAVDLGRTSSVVWDADGNAIRVSVSLALKPRKHPTMDGYWYLRYRVNKRQ